MNHIRKLHCVAALAVGMIGLWHAPALAVSQIEIGILTCDASAGMDATRETSLVCDFHATDGPSEAYSTIVKAFNLSEPTEGNLVWSVMAKKLLDHSGSLAGEYERMPNGALVGGNKKAFTLLPATGENLAQAVSKMTVVASN